MVFIFIIWGVYNYSSGISMGVSDYWGSLIILFAVLSGTLHMQNKE